MKYVLSVALGLVLVIAACGGGEDDADGGTAATNGDTAASTSARGDDGETTTSQAPATTIGAIGTSGNFCNDADTSEQLIDGIDFLSSDIEASVNQWLAVINAIEAEAPGEIADDVAVVADAARQFAALLEEADYQIINIDPEDERMAAFDDGSIDQATNNIAEYCGWDLDVLDGSGDLGGSGAAGNGEFGSDAMPDTIPEELVPPSVEGVNDNGVAGVNIVSSASFDELVGFYTDAIGDPDSEFGGTATFSGTVAGTTVFVILDDLGDQRDVLIVVISG